MADSGAYIAEFAENLWNNYIKLKLSNELQSNVTFYKATITANPGDGTLTVQRPFDNAVTISCSDDLKTAAVGSLVTVLVFGKGNASNHIAVSLAGMKDLRVASGEADYVVDYGYGTTGINTSVLYSGNSCAYWQKWNSGKLKIWGNSMINDLITTSASYGNGYLSATPITCWGTWPVAFTSNPVVNCSFVADGQSGSSEHVMLIPRFAPTSGGTAVNPKLYSPYYDVWSDAQDTFDNGGDYPEIAFSATGRWK